MSDARANVIGLSDYVYQRTRSRLAGLTDDEYFWEPVPGCWTIRRTGSGAYRTDYTDRPVAVLRPVTGAGDPSFTTIAWRLWHLIGCYGGKRNPQWLGVERPPSGFERDDPAPATAAQAIAVLDRAHAFWQDVLQELPAASWWEPLGSVAGPYAEDDKASLVLHQLDEQIHHGAELGVLRDLYRHGGRKSARLRDQGNPFAPGDGDGVTADVDTAVLDRDGQAATARGCLERAEAVAGWFNSAAARCIHSLPTGSGSRHTIAGLPPNGRSVKASTPNTATDGPRCSPAGDFTSRSSHDGTAIQHSRMRVGSFQISGSWP